MLKRALAIIVATLLLLIMGSALLGFLYQKKVKDFVVAQLNTKLNSEISVENIKFSLLEKFPYATLEFQKITAKDATDYAEKDTLLYADKLYLNFNIIDILFGNYIIKGIDLSDARMKLNVYEDGSNNYTFWKNSVDTLGEALLIELSRVNFSNVAVNYKFQPAGQLYSFIINI